MYHTSLYVKRQEPTVQTDGTHLEIGWISEVLDHHVGGKDPYAAAIEVQCHILQQDVSHPSTANVLGE